ncbi:hypothetical protein POSPLADRAFT_1046528 [Postia placenta MAD-698-R-SB12]|uniref:Uncharacterized protein n=1 Tax=Postia placenta MAD-698-R-SB12 TaxID=670580 RepID=A0A1X6N0E8_9APHY|nr:hypothetical protein POSPLADRAFT_1046528 [Postia placenta MAD-698-R-SB12]OSX62077.1 hypothetical protein POSPLADRAFT_1046528 [Postia placenta MAD-698-R-SB12]
MSPSQKNEPTFNILPHPAKSNDPKDLEPPQPGGGLNSNPEQQAFHARDPYVPSADLLKNVEQPLSREELRARTAQLNKQ